MIKFAIICSLLLLSVGCATPIKYNIDYSRSENTSTRPYAVIVDIEPHILNLKIENKSNSTLKLITDESVISTVDGRSIRLITGNTTIINRSNSQPPVIIPRKNTSSIKLMSANINTSMGVIIPESFYPYKNYDQFIGKEFSLLLTFEDSNGKKMESLYFFKVGPQIKKK